MECSVFNIKTAQEFADIGMIEDIIIKYNVRNIIELGTYKGGLSLYLKCLSINLDINYYGFDTGNIQHTKLGDLVSIYKDITIGDIFSEDIMDKIKDIINSGSALIICDNGNKIMEFNTFAPFLKEGDIIMAHDYNKEIRYSDICDTINDCRLKVIYENNNYIVCIK